MSEEDSEKIEPNLKFDEINNENNQCVAVSAVDVATCGVFPLNSKDSAILKLDIDCFEETFDYLHLKDLISIGETCQRLQNVSGYVFHQNYSNVLKQCTSDGCYAWVKSFDLLNKFEVNIFWRFIDRIYMRSPNELKHFLRIHEHFKRLKQICFDFISLTIEDSKCMKAALAKVESLRFVNCEVYGSLYDTILVFCPNLKHLYIDGVQIKDTGGCGTTDSEISNRPNDGVNSFNLENTTKNLKFRMENDWLRRRYPMLEHLELISYTEFLIELVIFFKLNPNIRKLTVNDEFLWENSEVMLHVNVKLDELAISRCSEGTIFRYCEEDEEEPPRENEPPLENAPLRANAPPHENAAANGNAPPANEKPNVELSNEKKEANGENGKSSTTGQKKDEPPKDERKIDKSNEYTFFELLNKLYARQFYRRLQWICYPTFFQELANEMISINGLTKLVLNTDTDPVTLSRLKNLEELDVGNSEQIIDLHILPSILTNLTRIHFEVVFFDQIAMMIGQALKLKKIQINSLLDRSRRHQDGTYDHIKLINLNKLNEERELLNGAGKVAIYVDEDVYLNTKWTLGNTDFNLIRLKRKESYPCGFDCHSLYWEFKSVIK